MTVNLDDMTVKQLRRHARDVAKALMRKEAAQAKKIPKKMVRYTKEIGENLGGFFGKTMTNENEPPAVKDIPIAKVGSEPPSTKDIPIKKAGPKPTSNKAMPSKKEATKAPKYIEPDGTPRQRLGKWSEKYTDKQLEKMKQK